MLFNSLHFLAFFPIVTILHFLIPHRFRWILLLAASYYFYMAWMPIYALVLLAATGTGYTVAILLSHASEAGKKKILLGSGIAVILGILFVFKYLDFFNELLGLLLYVVRIGYTMPALHLLLPLGISFHTFQLLSYLFDVYRGSIVPERHFGIFALYVSFFPQLMAGPIERAAHLIPQFYERHYFNIERTFDGLKLMLWGFFKKIVIADSAAVAVAIVFADPTHFNGPALLFASMLFMAQIYADFSGYTDIARGSAKILGFDLVLNFKRPYASRSISEFWQRWHISLTSWFGDYVFTPLYLTLSRAQIFPWLSSYQRNSLIFSFATLVGLTLLGLWHGAGLSFIIFGLSQAIFIIIYHLIKKWWDRLPGFLTVGGTLCMVLVGFILFRSESFWDGIYIITHLFSDWEDVGQYIIDAEARAQFLSTLGMSGGTALVLFLALLLQESVQMVAAHEKALSRWFSLPPSLRWLAYHLIVVGIILFGSFGDTPFIYFQF